MITALILAAGQSRRMGQPKLLLPWGESTVLEQVIATYKLAGAEDILVVTGAYRERIETLVAETARTVFNPGFARGEMLSSVQVGLRNSNAGAALIGPGDQPQVRTRSVSKLIESFRSTRASILIPSYQNRRGHPWLVARENWAAILDIDASGSLRDFLAGREREIQYVEVDDPGVLKDLDTYEEYLNSKP